MTPRIDWMRAVGIGSREGRVRKWRVDSVENETEKGDA